LREAFSYLYVVYWSYKFYVRLRVIGRVLPILLLLFFAADLVSPITHIFPWETVGWAKSVPHWVKITAVCLLSLIAGSLVYHHHRLQVRIERHNVLLTSIMVLTSTSIEVNDAAGSLEAASAILDGFAFALRHARKGIVNASIMCQSSPTEDFWLVAQDRDGAFDKKVSLDAQRSAAGAAASESPGSLIYVPATRFLHAVRMASESGVLNNPAIFRTTRIIPGAFEHLDGFYDPRIMRSLICVRLPLEGGAAGGHRAVLCLSSSKQDAFGDLDFHAAKVAASLIALAVKGF
jgi:hypothetical protein